MNKKLLFLFFLVLYTGNLLSQDPIPVERSDNKIILEGSVYYLHIVRAGQTLYSISRAYNLKEIDIERENPGVTSILKPGQILKIPMRELPEKTSSPERDTTKYLLHTFKKGETLFSLSRIHNTTVDELLKINPDIDPSTIKEGQIIYIPKSPSPVLQADEYIYHKVRRKETLYSISRRYGLSVDELKKHNPELYTSTLKTGTILNIPRYRDKAVAGPVMIQPERPQEDMIGITDTVIEPEVREYDDILSVYDDLPESGHKKAIDVALLIPFNFSASTDLSGNNNKASSGSTQSPDVLNQKPAASNYLDFLGGTLLAVDSLKKNGISVNLKVFDTKRDQLRMSSIIASGELNDMDLIIGPFSSSNAEIVSEFSFEKKIPLVIPFLSPANLINNNPYMFQLSTSTNTELNGIAEYMAHFDDCKIIILYTNDNDEYERASYLRSRLVQDFKESYVFRTPDIEDIFYDTSVKTDLSALISSTLSPNKKNMVIIPSTNEAFVYVAATQLFFQLKNFNIELYGMPQWSVFQNIDLLYLHALNLRFLSSYYFNYNNPAIKNYLYKFRKEFGIEPVTLTRKGANYAILAYDLSWFFINALNDYGKALFFHAEQLKYDLLMNSFQFKKLSPWSGFENTSLKVVRYTPELNVIQENFIFRNKIGYNIMQIKEEKEEEEETENQNF